MYQYVTKREVSPYRRICGPLLQRAASILNKETGPVEVQLMGSGGAGLVTRNGDEPFDLDYNLCFTNLPEKWKHNGKGLKDLVRHTLDREMGEGFRYGQDSTSSLCYRYQEKGTIIFSLDVAIHMRKEKGISRLIHDKEGDRFLWNFIPHTEQRAGRLSKIHEMGLWPAFRERYLQKKNDDIRKGLHTASFIIYTQTINEIYLLANKASMTQRSNALNPCSYAYKARMINRANQLNPNNPTYNGGKGKKKK
ncbi:hypothetical protein [uncultured Dialister sp.]|jgi:hypothetical protein|uniref:hypothetical protein n=1 Tax=uncultured Dialister sp. TaxID=278064 RepID=UPI0025E39FEA|nr:hypothetical protein [uncultured Dialister sp.]